MTTQEAMLILDPATTLLALAEIEYYAGFDGAEAKKAAVDEACLVAVEALQLKERQEQGLVVELPCKIGAKIFEADGHTGKVYETKAWKEHMLSRIVPMWGKRYFATRAEAEAAILKEGTE